MSEKYIPVTDEAKLKVEEALNKSKIFSSVDSFINLFNEAVINVRNENIKSLAELIAESYSNIILQGSKFFVKSPEEVYLEEASFVLEKWKLIASLQRVAFELSESDYDGYTKLIFLEEKGKVGYVYLEDGEELTRYEFSEKLQASAKEFSRNPILAEILNVYDPENVNSDNVYFTIQDLLELDNSFIKDINEVITTYSEE